MATQGLFNLLGATPEEIRAKYEQGLMGTPISSVPLESRPAAMGAGLGRQLGYTVGRMLGGRVPGEAEAEAQQAALLEAQQSGLSGSALYKRLADISADPRRALAFGQMAAEMEREEKLQAMEMEKAEFDIGTVRGQKLLRDELAKLPKTATSEDVLSVAKRFGNPTAVIEFAQKDIQAKAAAKAKLELEREKAATKQAIEKDKLEQRRREQEDRMELKRLMAAQTKATTDLQRQNLEAQVAERQARLDERKQKQEAEERAFKIKQDFMGRQVSKMLDDVKDAKDVVNEFSTGTGSNLLSALSWTDANKLANRLAAIKANIGFDKLQAMREASPTGGALGQVAVQELVALQNSIASLEQNQRPSELKKNLEKIETHYRNLRRIYSGELTEESVNQAGGAMSDDPLGLR